MMFKDIHPSAGILQVRYPGSPSSYLLKTFPLFAVVSEDSDISFRQAHSCGGSDGFLPYFPESRFFILHTEKRGVNKVVHAKF
jgi:hypothetical protein